MTRPGDTSFGVSLFVSPGRISDAKKSTPDMTTLDQSADFARRVALARALDPAPRRCHRGQLIDERGCRIIDVDGLQVNFLEPWYEAKINEAPVDARTHADSLRLMRNQLPAARAFWDLVDYVFDVADRHAAAIDARAKKERDDTCRAIAHVRLAGVKVKLGE